MNLKMVETILSERFDVRVAKSAEFARKVLSSEKIDLLLLDIELPGINGLDFLKELKNVPSMKEVPVIIVTSYSSSQVLSTAIRSGAAEYILKPYDPQTLLEKITKTLEGAV
jgi:DNA-binding response OmpR family regulator